MISTSIPSTPIIDVIIIGLIFLVLGLLISQGAFKKGRMADTGRLLMIGGLVVAVIFELLDLLVLYEMPQLTLDRQADAVGEVLYADLRWIVSILSVLLVASGFIVVVIQRRELEEENYQAETLAADAGQRAAELELHFRAMLERSTDSIYCFEFRPPIPVTLPVEEQVARSFDAVLGECNLAFAKAIGVATRDEAIGLRLGDMHSIMSPESHVRFYRKFIEQGYQLSDYQFSFMDPEGNKHLLLISVAGEVKDGELVRLWGSDKNILEQSEVRDSLVERLKFQEFVARISSRILLAPMGEVKDALVDCLKDICVQLNGDRMTIVWLDREQKTVEPIYFWNETGTAPWPTFSLDEIPAVVQKLFRGIPVIINSLEELAKESEVDANRIATLGVKSLVAVPLLVDGEVVGACTIGAVHNERTWSHYDVVDLHVLADLIANVVFRIKAHAALNQALMEIRSMKDRLEAENIYLRQEIILNNSFDELIGQSEGLRACLHQVQQVAATPTSVLVLGETGTGKELVVRAMHQISDRNDRPLVKVNCAALPADLIESELFGHEQGAFTGATSKKRGRFDLADGGTLFLDEIGDFPLELQGKLLRVIQEGEFQRVGGIETIKVDVRLIAATNRELQNAVDSGRFRADLYYRIGVYPISLPPLRDRPGDVRLLAEHFVQKHSAGLGKDITAISAPAMDQLEAYSWPGNIRELESVIQRALISAEGPVLHLAEVLGSPNEHHPAGLSGSGDRRVDLFGAEKAHIERVLDQAGWVVAGGTGAAVKLGVPESTLRSKMKKLGIHRPPRNSPHPEGPDQPPKSD